MNEIYEQISNKIKEKNKITLKISIFFLILFCISTLLIIYGPLDKISKIIFITLSIPLILFFIADIIITNKSYNKTINYMNLYKPQLKEAIISDINNKVITIKSIYNEDGLEIAYDSSNFPKLEKGHSIYYITTKIFLGSSSYFKNYIIYNSIVY